MAIFLCPAGAALADDHGHRPVVQVDPGTGRVHIEVGGGAIRVDTAPGRARVRTGGTTVTASTGPGGARARVETRHCPRYESTVSGSATGAGARGSVSWRSPCGAHPAPKPKPKPPPKPARTPPPAPVRRATPAQAPTPTPTPTPTPSPTASATARTRMLSYAGPPSTPPSGGPSLVTLTLLVTAPAVLAAATLRPQGGSRRRAR